jgi:tRNA G18 (ribose-2'-O)-methylase SpoU
VPFLQNFEVEKNKKYALVLKKFTVFQEAVASCDGCIEIPQLGTKHSLNISVSAGMLFDLF